MAYLRNNELQKKLGEKIKRLRTERKITLEELANISEIELSQVHRLEQGKVNAYLATIDAIAKGLEISLSELFKDL